MASTKILIVEDEGIVALDIKSRLENSGFTVTGIAVSGAEAISLARKEPPDLILMDIMIQGDIDGIQTAEQILKEQNVPILFLTAYSDEATVNRAKIGGSFGYIIKPFDDRDLQISIEMALYRFEMDNKVKESEQWLSTTLNSIGDAVVATDKNGLITFFNPAAEILVGEEEAAVLGKPVREVLNLITEESCSPAKDPVEVVLNRGVVPNGDHCIFISRNGRKVPIEDSGAPIIDDRDNVLGAVLVFRDITDKKEAEKREKNLQDKLTQAEKMRSLGVLAGGVAHDLNNLLGPLVAYPDLMMSSLSKDSEMYDMLEQMQYAAERAADVIQDLLTLARRGRYEMEPMNLNKLVKEYLKAPHHEQFMNKYAQVTLESELNSEIGNITGSPINIMKVIMNLVVNSLEAMPEGGKLCIKTDQQYLEKLQSGFDRIKRGEYIILSVKDTGIGIEKNYLGQIFEPYFSQKKMGRSGSGLGLAVVYGIIKDHGAYYDVFSTVGKGSEFILYFPVSNVDVSDESGGQDDNIGGTEKILVVDDTVEQRKLAVEILKSLGYEAESVANGTEAVKYMNESSADLLVLDMIMEDSFDGLDTYREILKDHPSQKAIIVSGFSPTDRVRRMQELGAGSYVKKPYNTHALGQAVRQELDRQPVPVVK